MSILMPPGLKQDSSLVMSDELMAQTVMQFFMDGHTTVAALVKFTFYFLALNPEVQDAAMQEVDDFADRHGDDINRDNVDELKYLEQVGDKGIEPPISCSSLLDAILKEILI